VVLHYKCGCCTTALWVQTRIPSGTKYRGQTSWSRPVQPHLWCTKPFFHVYLVVLVKHGEVRRKHECLLEYTYAHAFEAQAVAAAAPSPLYSVVRGQTARDKTFCTRMTTQHPIWMLADTNNAHGILNCAHLCISLPALCTCSYCANAQLVVRRHSTVGTASNSQWYRERCLRS